MDHAIKWDETKTRNGGMMEWRKIAPNPKRRNGRKLPQILKGGMAMIESNISKTRCIRTSHVSVTLH